MSRKSNSTNPKGSLSPNNFTNQNSSSSFNRDKPNNNFNEINVINEDEEHEESNQYSETVKETQKEDRKDDKNNINRNKQQPDIYFNKNLEAKTKNGKLINNFLNLHIIF